MDKQLYIWIKDVIRMNYVSFFFLHLFKRSKCLIFNILRVAPPPPPHVEAGVSTQLVVNQLVVNQRVVNQRVKNKRITILLSAYFVMGRIEYVINFLINL